MKRLFLTLAVLITFTGCRTSNRETTGPLSDILSVPTGVYPMAGTPRYRVWYNQSDGSSKWCPKQSRFGGRGGGHQGVDLDSNGNTPLLAIAAGTIEYNPRNDPDGWGNHIYLYFKRDTDTNTYIAVYAHLDPISAFPSPKAVRAGDAIGTAGCTGNAGGGTCDRTHKCRGADGVEFVTKEDHLHLELKRRISVTPEKWEQLDPVKFFGWNVKYEADNDCGMCLSKN